MDGQTDQDAVRTYVRKVRSVVPALGRALCALYGRERVREAMQALVERGTYTIERLHATATGPPDGAKWQLITDILTTLGADLSEFYERFLQAHLKPGQQLSVEDLATLHYWLEPRSTSPTTAA